MTTFSKSSLPSLLAIAIAGTLLTACGSDDKPNINVDNTDVPNNNDNGGERDINLSASPALGSNYPRYEDGKYEIDKNGAYSCFTWKEERDNQAEIEDGTLRCGILQYTVTAGLTEILKVPTNNPVTVDYKLTSPNGNVADILKDPSMVSGTITLHKENIQHNLNIPLKTDNKATGDWEIDLVLSNPTGGGNLDNLNTAILKMTVIDPQSSNNGSDDNAIMETINDTGVNFSGNLIKGNETTCATGVNGNQDCTIGRDATDNDNADGVAGFSFTKLDSAGEPLAATAESWECIKDNVTGKIWEHKTYMPKIEGKYGAEGNANKDYRDSELDYSYYDASVSLGDATGGNTDCKLGDDVKCNTANYIAKMNSDAVCGITNWRLPTRLELLDLANLGGHESYQTMHAKWLFTDNGKNDAREWLNYNIPTQFWSSSVAASYDTHDGYTSPRSLKFNEIWTMYPDGSLNLEDPSSSYSTAGILAVSSTD